ncbi:MAG: sugar ABC transporter permease [Anaerolineae bacterium]
MSFRSFELIPKGKLARNEAMWFYIFISPWLIGFIIFTLYPIVASAYFSLTIYDIVRAPRWIGLGNYAELLDDKLFWQSLKVTFYYTGLAVPLTTVAALSLAQLLNQRVPFLSVFRTVYYLPSIVTGVAVALLWQWILNPEFGLVNYLLSSLFGIKGPGWFFDKSWAIPSYVLMSLWGLGAPMIIYLAALQNVPTELYEAAQLDGAGPWKRFRHITIPMISPVILFNVIVGIIGSFQVFTQIYVITTGRGGPSYASLVYVLYLFQNAFRNFRMGYASAQAWILFWIIFALTVAALRVSRRRVYYESPGENI